MLLVDKILFASDFTPCSERALAFACDLAALTGAGLHVVYARVGEEGRTGPPDEDRELVARLYEQVARVRVRNRWASHTPLRTSAAVVRGATVAGALRAHAEAVGASLIVMGTNGRRGLRRLVLGSVATDLVRRAACPVVTVGGSEVPYTGLVRSILVPVDFSDHAREALRHARELAAFFGARIDLLHVIDVRIHPAFYDTGVFGVDDLVPGADRKAAARLAQFYRETEGPLDTFHAEVVTGYAPAEIVAHARRVESDLIVLSTHGLTGLEHFLIGSVAEKVVRAAPCPVLTVKAFGPSLVRTAPGEVVEEIDLVEE